MGIELDTEATPSNGQRQWVHARLSPDVVGPWCRWPDPTRGGTVPLSAVVRSSRRPAASTSHRAPRADDPVAIVSAVVKYAAELRQSQSQRPDECITVSTSQVVDCIGLAHASILTSNTRGRIEKLCWSTLLILGFEPGTRGKSPVSRQPNKVLRLPAGAPTPAARASQSSAIPACVQPAATEHAKLDHTGPNGTACTQRRLAAEKRARFGHTPT